MDTNYRLTVDLSPGKVKVPGLRHYVSVSMLWLVLLEAVGVTLAFGVNYANYEGGWGWETLFRPEPYVYSIFLLACLAAQGVYRVHYRHTYGGTFARIALGFGLSLALFGAISYLLPASSLALGGGVVVPSLMASFLPVLILHTLYFELVDRSALKRKVLVLGAGKRAASLSELKRKSDFRTARIDGFVRCDGDDVCVPRDRISDVDLGDLSSYVAENRIDELVVAFDGDRGDLHTEALLACKMQGVGVIDLGSFFERESGKLRLDALSDGWLVFSHGFEQNHKIHLLRRAMDVSISLALLFLLFPLMFLTALAISAEGGGLGSAFFRQRRTGLNGADFDILKFRSMRLDAEKGGVAQWAKEGDERITRVGRFIRKYRIDELPQLINVLRGDMSLVGPRPERPEFVRVLRQKIPYYDYRHRVRPGITGWAQLNYPYGASEKDALEKLQYDLYYVKNNSWLLDIGILLQTAEVIFFKKGSR